MNEQQATLDQERLGQFLGMAVGDLGAAISATLVLAGDRLGLYKALADDPATPAELAQRTGTHERYVREWLGNQAAGGYVQYDAASGRYSLDQVQALQRDFAALHGSCLCRERGKAGALLDRLCVRRYWCAPVSRG